MARLLGSDPVNGLVDSTVDEHRAAYGANKFKEQPPKSFWSLVWDNLQDPIVRLLCFAAAVGGMAPRGVRSSLERIWNAC